MTTMEEQVAIQALKDKGLGIREIARKLQLSRNTVRRYLRRVASPEYAIRRPPPNAELERFRKEIDSKLGEELIGSRILNDLRQQGYQGPARTFYRYLARVRTEVEPSPAVERFETGPGKQGQYDWSEYTVVIGGILTKVYLHSLILGYSRYQHLSASLHIRQSAIFEALEDSFQHFGGVPQEVLFDNPRALVTHPKPTLVWNQRFLELVRFYNFTPYACWPGRPQTKGKVERPFQMAEEHFIKGNTFTDWRDFLRRLMQCEVIVLNSRLHSTTQERPIDRFEHEQALLTQLPATRFISSRESFRHVSIDCLISFNGSRYSVPWQYAGKEVWLRLTRDLGLEIISQQGEVLARHAYNPKKGSINSLKEHYQGLREQANSRKLLVARIFTQRFPEATAQRFLEKLLSQYKFNAAWHLRRIMGLLAATPRAVALAAFEQALTYNTFSCHFLQGILTSEESPLAAGEITLFSPERAIPKVQVERGLERYQDFLTPAPATKAKAPEAAATEPAEVRHD